MKELARFVSVFVLRALPGLLNLAALILVSRRLSNEDFGFYSTSLAAIGVLSSLFYGPVQFSIVSQYGKAEKCGQDQVYVISLLVSAAVISVFLVAFSILLTVVHDAAVVFALLLFAMGTFHITQELFRVKLRFVGYSVSALIQSGMFVVLVYVFVQSNVGYVFPVALLAASYVSGVVCGICSLRLAWVQPDFSSLKGVYGVGLPYTLSTLSEGSIFLGFRFALLFFANPAYLGIFSFCLDFAQRTVGFIMSVGGFLYVPRAFRSEAGEFGSLLNTGAILSVVLAVVGLLAIMLYSAAPASFAISLPAFDAGVFLWLGLAVIMNRAKKILLDPLVMRDSRVSSLFWGYLLAAALSIPTVSLLCYSGLLYLVPPLYLITILAAALTSWWLYGLVRGR